jgi:hypothetical protein
VPSEELLGVDNRLCLLLHGPRFTFP